MTIFYIKSGTEQSGQRISAYAPVSYIFEQKLETFVPSEVLQTYKKLPLPSLDS